MKRFLKAVLATVALAVPLMAAAPAAEAAVPAKDVAVDASVSGTFSCSRGVTTQMYAPNGYDYHEVNYYYYLWYAPSDYWTTVNWSATSGYWYLESNVGFRYRVYCR